MFNDTYTQLKTFTLFTFLVISCSLWGYSETQTNKLKAAADTATGVNKADAFVNLAEYYFQNFYGMNSAGLDSTIKYFTEALSISLSSRDVSRVVKILGKVSVIYYSIGDYRTSLNINRKLLFFTRKYGMIEDQVNVMNRLALTFKFLNLSDSAVYYFRQTYNLGVQNKQYFTVAMSQIGYGDFSLGNGNQDSAIVFYLNGLEFLKKDIQENGFSFYDFFDDDFQPISYNRIWNLAMTYVAITNYYIISNQSKQALFYSDSALILSNHSDNKYLKSIVIGQKNDIWNDLGNKDSLIK